MEYANKTGLQAPQVDQRRIEREARRLARANCKIADANALAAPEVAQLNPRVPIKWAARPPPQRSVTIGAGSIAGKCATPPAAQPSRPTASRRRRACWAIG